LRGLALDALLRRKGRVLDTLARRPEGLSEQDERRRVATEARLKELRAERAAQVFKAADLSESDAQIEDTEQDEIEALEEILSALRGVDAAAPRDIVLAVQRALPERSLLIEFVRYDPCRPRRAPGGEAQPARYGAFVLDREKIAGAVDLGETEPIDDTIRAFLLGLSSPLSPDVRGAGHDLAARIFEPLRPAIGGATTLFVAPDGLLSLVPFEALTDESHRYAIESFTFSYVTTGRDLLRERRARGLNGGVVVMADPDYDGARDAAADEVERLRGVGQDELAALKNVHFEPLPGTSLEARALRNVFPDAQVLTGAAATESALRSLRNPRVLHLATHGFFLPDDDRPHVVALGGALRDPLYRDPMLRCGLALAGANGRGQPGMADGLMTAAELASLDWSGTRLVALSACETGLGRVREAEGVYGLRRALALAGVETQIVSLWKVSDRATCYLMTRFYASLRTGRAPPEALRRAKLDLMAERHTNHPFYWASFVVSGIPSAISDL
jgi:CHAT domain-containing protein